MSLGLLGAGGIILYLLGLAAGRFYPLVNLLWLVYWLAFAGLTILWSRHHNRRIENILQGQPDPDLVNRPFPVRVSDFARMDLGLSRIYGKIEISEADLLDQKVRYGGQNLDLLIKSTTDPLTGLLNRKQLNCHLQKVLGALTPLSAVMADIDHFKSVNDTYGHDAGDAVLKQFALAVRGAVRPADYVFRYGGEEFILICCAGIKEAMEIAERVREKVEKTPIAVNSMEISVTSSFGVAEYCPGDTPESLIKRADEALYRAKQSGRNRVCGEFY